MDVYVCVKRGKEIILIYPSIRKFQRMETIDYLMHILYASFYVKGSISFYLFNLLSKIVINIYASTLIYKKSCGHYLNVRTK